MYACVNLGYRAVKKTDVKRTRKLTLMGGSHGIHQVLGHSLGVFKIVTENSRKLMPFITF